jgi:hypothetical protein
MERYLVEEWTQTERELLREKGLWGPYLGSRFDKWMLDMTEGQYMFYFVELCMKRDHFGCNKKEICPIKNMQKHIILESSEQCANGLLH